jgi:tetratricopeptide (TPR) repeat protein
MQDQPPSASEVLLSKAYEAAERDDWAMALDLFNQALDLRPGWQEALYAKACTLYEIGDVAAALATLDQVDIEYGKQDGSVWSYRSKIYLANECYQDAFGCIVQAIACKPLFVYWKLKAEALEGLGRHTEAQTAQAEFYHRWGLLDFRHIIRGNGNPRDMGDALRMFDSAHAADPEFWPAIRDRAIVLARTDRADEALDILATALEREPEEGMIWAAYGHAMFHLQRYDDALRAFEHAIALKPDDADARRGKDAVTAALRPS